MGETPATRGPYMLWRAFDCEAEVALVARRAEELRRAEVRFADAMAEARAAGASVRLLAKAAGWDKSRVSRFFGTR